MSQPRDGQLVSSVFDQIPHSGASLAPEGDVSVRLDVFNNRTGQWDSYGVIPAGDAAAGDFRVWNQVRSLPPWTPNPDYWRGVDDPVPGAPGWRLQAKVRAVHIGGPANGVSHATFESGTQPLECLLQSPTGPIAGLSECASPNSPTAAILAECGDVGETCCTTLDSARDPLCFQTNCKAGFCQPCGAEAEECCDGTAAFAPRCDSGLSCSREPDGASRCRPPPPPPPPSDECGPDDALFPKVSTTCETGAFGIGVLIAKLCFYCNDFLPPVFCNAGIPVGVC